MAFIRRITSNAFSILLIMICAPAAQAIVPMSPYDNVYTSSNITEMREKADQGDAHAQHWMGDLYFYGQGIPSDYIEATNWYKKAGAQGYSVDYELSQITRFTTKHAQLYAAAQSGNAEALYAFAKDEPHNSTGLKGDAPRAHWLLLAALKGHQYSQSELGRMYFDAYYRRRIELAHAEAVSANYLLKAPLDFDDESIKKDLPNAIKWLEKACTQGEMASCILSAQLHAINDSPQYMDTLWASIKDDGSTAPDNSCDILFTGKLREYPVEPSSDTWLLHYDHAPEYERARACYEKIGGANAWYRLGVIYHGGLGIARDDQKASEYLMRALQWGGPYRSAAAYELALIYMDSSVIMRDDTEAYIRLNEAIAWLSVPVTTCSPQVSLPYNRLNELNYHVRTDAQNAYEALVARISPESLAKANVRLTTEGIIHTEDNPPPPPPLPCV